MLTRLAVDNFRSIERCEVELGPITVFFGPTSAGKSSLFYGLLALRNFVLNPNQAVDGLFNFGFQNLGGFDACVFDHRASKAVSVTAHFDRRSYGINLTKADVDIHEDTEFAQLKAKVPVPYNAGQQFPFSLKAKETEFTVNWNGFAATVAPKTATADSQAAATELTAALSAPVELIKRIDICPHRRGFFKPSYSPVPLTPTPTNEDEVASLIINDPNSAARISINTVEVFDRDFRVYTAPGTATTFLQTTEQGGARIPGYLVNDGFGVNQVVYLLAKIHRPEVDTILIEEPEVHLHPTVIRKFARVLAHFAANDEKQLIFTTHSEQFLLSLLACVKEGFLKSDQLRCYQVTRRGKKTEFTYEPVSEDGQISGGLASFMEGELLDIRTFLSASQ